MRSGLTGRYCVHRPRPIQEQDKHTAAIPDALKFFEAAGIHFALIHSERLAGFRAAENQIATLGARVGGRLEIVQANEEFLRKIDVGSACRICLPERRGIDRQLGVEHQVFAAGLEATDAKPALVQAGRRGSCSVNSK